MAELGETVDPRALVPGDAEAVRALGRALTAYAGDLREAGNGLRVLGAGDGWRGPGADAFRERFEPEPARWLQAGDALTTAARALSVYAETLIWAQRQAVDAVGWWASGEAGRVAAVETLGRARAQLADAGDDAALRLEGAAEVAPRTPWGHLEAAADGAVDAGAHAGNAILSVGNAMLDDPASVAAMVGGAALVALGGAGTGGGAAATATGAGAPVGVPVTAASVGLIATGLGVAGAGAMAVARGAIGPDRVTPLETGRSRPEPAPTPAARMPSVENRDLSNIVRPLYRGIDKPSRTGDGTTGAAVRAERASGAPTSSKYHTTKANETVRALRRWLKRNPEASPSDRGVAQSELDDLLDALGRAR